MSYRNNEEEADKNHLEQKVDDDSKSEAYVDFVDTGIGEVEKYLTTISTQYVHI